MNRLVSGCLVVLLIIAAFSAVNAQNLKATSRYLVDSSNTPVFISGDAAWSLMNQVSTSDAEYYFKNRKSYGFNFAIVDLIEHYYATNAPKNYYGVAPFSGETFSTPVEAYFAHADTVLSLARKYGINVFLYPVYLGYNCGSEGWCSEIEAASDSAMAVWGKYLGNRYKNCPNLVWVIGCDTDPTPVKSKLLVFVNALRGVDSVHVITAEDGRNTEAVDAWSGQSWLTLNSIYTGSSAAYTQCKTAYNVSPSLPFFLVEGYYENDNGMTEQKLRAQAYYTVLGGGCGHVFGNTPVWYFSYNQTDWKSSLDDTGSVCMSYLQALFNARHWYKLIPDYSNSAVTSGYGTWGSSSYVMAAYASDSTTMMAYLPSGSAITVNTLLLKDSVTAFWFNPATNVSTSLGRLSHSSSVSIASPGSGDWVFVADAASSTVSNAITGSFSATPTTTAAGGGTVSLRWTSTGATSASISPSIGTVNTNDSTTVTVTTTTTFTLTLSNSSTSSTYSVTVTVPVLPAATTITFPANGATGVSLSPTIKWDSVSAATSYRLQVATDTAFSSIVVDSTIQKTSFTPSLSYATKYFVRVRSVNSVGSSSYSSIVAFTTQAKPVAATSLIIYSDSLASNWSTVRSYGNTITLKSKDVTPYEGTYELKSVTKGWGCLQVSNGSWSAFTSMDPSSYDSVTFSARSNSGTVKIYVSLSGSSGASLKTPIVDTLTTKWRRFAIPMSKLSSAVFSTIIFSNQSSSSFTWYADDVRLILHQSTSSSELETAVSAEASPAPEEKGPQPLLSAYPNPFNPTTLISYSLLSSGKVTVKVYDIVGREIETLVSNVQESGTYQVSWNANRYSSGNYFVVMTTSDKTVVKKVLLIK